MTVKLEVPSMVCEVCAQNITQEIQTSQPEAKVEIDLATKVVAVETTASATEIRQIITAAGHEVK